MTEEEKKAIEDLKNIVTDLEDAENGAIISLQQDEIDSLKIIAELIEKQQKEIKKLQRNLVIIIDEITNQANEYDYLNKITAGTNNPPGIAYVTLLKLLEEINKKVGLNNGRRRKTSNYYYTRTCRQEPKRNRRIKKRKL